jgi:hypothetical protein
MHPQQYKQQGRFSQTSQPQPVVPPAPVSECWSDVFMKSIRFCAFYIIALVTRYKLSHKITMLYSLRRPSLKTKKIPMRPNLA